MPEIGAMDGDSETKIPVLGGEVSPGGPKVPFLTIFAIFGDFWQNRSKSSGFMAESGQNGQNWPF